MEIVSIFGKNLYSAKFDNQELAEFDRLLDSWEDYTDTENFIKKYYDCIDHDIFPNISNAQDAANTINNEAYDLDDYYINLYDNCQNSKLPDFDTHFQPLDGPKYRYIYEYTPMKSYGKKTKPSFLRMYAVKLSSNCYIVTGGGIKLAKTIQDSPELKDTVFNNIDLTRKFLKANNIETAEEIEQLNENDYDN